MRFCKLIKWDEGTEMSNLWSIATVVEQWSIM